MNVHRYTMYLCIVFLREWVGNTCIEWMILIYLITKWDQRRLFPKAHTLYFQSYIFHLRVTQTIQPHTVNSHTLFPWGGNECLHPFHWKMKPKSAERWNKLWRCQSSPGGWPPSQQFPPWVTMMNVQHCLVYVITTPPHLHHSFGRNYSFDWKFSILGLHSKEEERWKSKSKKKCSLLCS